MDLAVCVVHNCTDNSASVNAYCNMHACDMNRYICIASGTETCPLTRNFKAYNIFLI